MPATRILIADDSKFMRLMLRRLLEQNGYEVVGEAADGLEALRQYQALKPDVVTLDVTMPRMDGLSALKEILKIDPGARIIVCSAMGQRWMIIEAVAAGARDFLVKPLRPQRVLEAIRKVGASTPPARVRRDPGP